jgi:methionine biosynthesis protein MetW
MRLDLQLIQHWIKPDSRVLDLGCGDGTLLKNLQDNLQVKGIGVEIDPDQINQCITKGLNVIEQDLNRGLGNFEDNSFDVVVMTQALQTLRHPHEVLEEMLRVGRQCIVTFPNFGHWRCRWHLGQHGRMPVSKFMPYTWYDTPNIHFCTVKDFDALCQQQSVQVLNRTVVSANNQRSWIAQSWPNLFGVTAVYHISR